MSSDDVRNKKTTAFKDKGKNIGKKKKTKQSEKIANGGIFYCWRLTPFSLNSWGNNKTRFEVEKYWVVARIIFFFFFFFCSLFC